MSSLSVFCQLPSGETISQQFARDVTVDEVKKALLEASREMSPIANWRLTTAAGKPIDAEYSPLATCCPEVKQCIETTDSVTLCLKAGGSFRGVPKSPSARALPPLAPRPNGAVNGTEEALVSPRAASGSSVVTVMPLVPIQAGGSPFRRLPAGAVRASSRASSVALSTTDASASGNANGERVVSSVYTTANELDTFDDASILAALVSSTALTTTASTASTTATTSTGINGAAPTRSGRPLPLPRQVRCDLRRICGFCC
jgi:hypothetical protein